METPDEPIRLEEQIACVEREIGFRERLYPRWVKQGKLTQTAADLELARLRAVHATLLKIGAGDVVVISARPLDEGMARRSERLKVLEIVGRTVHSGQYMRIEAAVRRELGA